MPGPAIFRFSDPQHRGGEINADDTPGAALPGHSRQRQVSSAGAEIEHGLAPGQLQDLDGLRRHRLSSPALSR